MEFRQLEAFVNAVKYKSFSRAADVMFLTQPTLSTHVGNLENELGVKLLNRTGREIVLTARGREFYSYALELLNTRERAVYAVQGDSQSAEGILEIQTSTIPGQHYLPALMEEFHRMYPKVRFYVEQSDSRIVNENLMNQRGELGFTGYRGNSGLCYEAVFHDGMVLITPNDPEFSDLPDGAEISADRFIHKPFVIREDGSGTKAEMEKALVDGVQVFKNVDVIARMSNMAAIEQVVSRGLGVSIVSESVVRNGNFGGQIRYFKIKGLKKERTFYLVFNKNISLSPAAEAFLRLARERKRLHEAEPPEALEMH